LYQLRAEACHSSRGTRIEWRTHCSRFLFSSGKHSGRPLLETIEKSCYSRSLSVRSFGFPLSLSLAFYFSTYLSYPHFTSSGVISLRLAASAEISSRQVRGRILTRSSDCGRFTCEVEKVHTRTYRLHKFDLLRPAVGRRHGSNATRNGGLVSPNHPVTRRFGDRIAELSDISKFPSKIRHIDRDGRSDGTRRRIDCCTLKLDNLPNRRGAILNSNFSAILI